MKGVTFRTAFRSFSPRFGHRVAFLDMLYFRCCAVSGGGRFFDSFSRGMWVLLLQVLILGPKAGREVI